VRNTRLSDDAYQLRDPEAEARLRAAPVTLGYTEEELQAARAEAHRAGREDAWLEIAPLKRELEAETARAVAALHALAGRLEGEFRRMLSSHAEDLCQFAFEIASRVVRVELRQRPEAIVPLVREMLEQAASAERVHVRLSTRDFNYLKQDPAHLPETLAFPNLRLRPDSSLEPGGCVVESEQGNWDARVATQLARIELALNEPRPDLQLVERENPLGTEATLGNEGEAAAAA